MLKTSETEVLGRLMRPLSRELSAELARALLRLQADEAAQARYDRLAARNSEGTLGAEEREELSALVRANTVLALLKAEAQASLHDVPAV